MFVSCLSASSRGSSVFMDITDQCLLTARKVTATRARYCCIYATFDARMTVIGAYLTR